MNNMANVLFELGRSAQALDVYQKLLKIRPNDVTALKNVATIHLTQRDFVKAHDHYRRAYHINPQHGDIAGAYWYALAFICNWQEHDQVLEQLLADEYCAQARPLTACLFSDEPAKLLGHAKHFAQTQYPPSGVLGPLPSRTHKPKIRLAYYSSDFYTHATVMLIRGLIAAHDRERFEVHGFSLQPPRNDEGYFKIRSLFDHFHEVHALSDRAVALLSRQLEIDIAIDLKGYTEGSRPQIFAERAAPLQVNFLGYPGTMGASFMDAIIADPYVIPEGQEQHYTERVLRMPHCYQPNDPQRPKPTGTSPRPSELPPDAFVFCCYNNSHKISPSTFQSWMRILQQTPRSVLWLLKTNDAARDNLWSEAVKAGIDKERLIFAPFLPEAEHLERLSHADLFLDTYPYNAHTSASDAVWAGVPVLTRSGNSFASRVAGSILSTIGLTELISTSNVHYESLAIELHNDAQRLKILRAQVRPNTRQCSLYDSRFFAKTLENLLITDLTASA
jgi:predicted O-linked N-acetylglucosamine transferase (SPINDLY family)